MNNSRRNLLKACLATVPFLATKNLLAEKQTAKDSSFFKAKIECKVLFNDDETHPIYKDKKGRLIIVPLIALEDYKELFSDKITNFYHKRKENVYITFGAKYCSILESKEHMEFVKFEKKGHRDLDFFQNLLLDFDKCIGSGFFCEDIFYNGALS